jgi:ubiquinone/menaquinone biosynthesis C-methylase UbiE
VRYRHNNCGSLAQKDKGGSSSLIKGDIVLEMQCELYVPGSRITQETYRIHLARYVFASKFVPGADVLDVACGSGYGSSYLLRKGAKSVVGADINEDAIKAAITNFQRAGLTFQAAKAEDLPFPADSFDVITSMGTIDHLDDPGAFLLGAQRALRDGGYFICSLLNREMITPFPVKEIVDPYHKIEYAPLELADLVSHYFGNIKLYGQNCGHKRWWQIRRIVYYIIYRKLHLPYAVPLKMQRFIALLGKKELKYMTYSEDRIDSDFATDNEWTQITSKEMASKFANYLVVGQKLSTWLPNLIRV